MSNSNIEVVSFGPDKRQERHTPLRKCFEFLSKIKEPGHFVPLPTNNNKMPPNPTETEPKPKYNSGSKSKSKKRSTLRSISHTNHTINSEQQSNITNNVENLFIDLQKKIQEYNDTIEAVEKFFLCIEEGKKEGIFDDQDIGWIEDDLKCLRDQRLQKETEYKKRKELYDNSVVKLEDVLERRKILIEEADQQTGVFNMRPELLKKFAQKRATLMKIVDQGKQDIQQPHEQIQ